MLLIPRKVSTTHVITTAAWVVVVLFLVFLVAGRRQVGPDVIIVSVDGSALFVEISHFPPLRKSRRSHSTRSSLTKREDLRLRRGAIGRKVTPSKLPSARFAKRGLTGASPPPRARPPPPEHSASCGCAHSPPSSSNEAIRRPVYRRNRGRVAYRFRGLTPRIVLYLAPGRFGSRRGRCSASRPSP